MAGQDDSVPEREQCDASDIQVLTERWNIRVRGCLLAVWESRAPEFSSFTGGEKWTAAFELKVQRKKDSLEKGKDGGEDDEPHLDQMGNKALVRDVAECLVQGQKAGLEELGQIADQNIRGPLLDAAPDVNGDKSVEIFDWGPGVFAFKDMQETSFEQRPGVVLCQSW